MKRLLTALVGTLLVVATAVGQECNGSAGPFGFNCSNPCSQGCTFGTTTLPNGSVAQICICDIVGPQPNCCRLGVLPSGALVKTGSCLVAGCATSGYCRLVGIYDAETGQLLYATTECEPPGSGH